METEQDDGPVAAEHQQQQQPREYIPRTNNLVWHGFKNAQRANTPTPPPALSPLAKWWAAKSERLYGYAKLAAAAAVPLTFVLLGV
mmetsp:Transcript_2341/g.5249  ORF Transcript_2341/g.5249 Transcript_2341/m.5249 type:complete len:86 (+) Transcript_2341:110-367(+)